MLRRLPSIAPAASFAKAQKRSIVFFSRTPSYQPNVIGATERTILNLLAEGLAFFLTYELLRRRREWRGANRWNDIFDWLKKAGINADELANSKLISYDKYYFDLRFFFNYVAICVGMCVITIALPASFHGPFITRMIVGRFYRR